MPTSNGRRAGPVSVPSMRKGPHLELERVQPPAWRPEHSCRTVGEKPGPVRTGTGRHESADAGRRRCCHAVKPTGLRETLTLRPTRTCGPGTQTRPRRPPWPTWDHGCGHVRPDTLTSPLKMDHYHVNSSAQRRFVIQKRKQSLFTICMKRFVEIPVLFKK